MDYSIGSLADLITGKNTPGKVSVKQTIFKLPKKDHEQTEETISENLETNNSQEVKKKRVKKDAAVKKNKKSMENDEEPSKRQQRAEFFKKVKDKKVKKRKSDSSQDETDSTPTKKVKHELSDDNDREEKETVKVDPEVIKEHNSRTIFVGNVPVSVSRSQLKKYFKKFGQVESVRLRCVPLADPRISKRVSAITKQFHAERTSAHCFIRYIKRDDALKAISANGVKYNEHHLRIVMSDDFEKPDESKAIFVGNLAFAAEEDDLWKTFESCGSISHVRIVRDPKTQIGKGFGYVNFESADSVELALQMDDVQIKNRLLRISRCNTSSAKKKGLKKKKFKSPKLFSSDNLARNGNFKDGGGFKEKKFKAVDNSEYQGTKFSEKKKKKKTDKGLLKKKKISNMLLKSGKKPKKQH